MNFEALKKFEWWKGLRKSAVVDEELIRTTNLLTRGAKQLLKDLESSVCCLVKKSDQIVEIISKYIPLMRFPTGILKDVDEIATQSDVVTKLAQDHLCSIISIAAITDITNMNSEERKLVTRIKERKIMMRVCLLQVQSISYVTLNNLVHLIAGKCHLRLDELDKLLDRYCGDLSIQSPDGNYSLRTQLCDNLSEVEEMQLDQRASKVIAWNNVLKRRKRIIKIITILSDAEDGLPSQLDNLGARGGGNCTVCETDFELRSALCGHKCCKVCWRIWLKKSETCPMCRRPVRSRELQVGSGHMLHQRFSLIH